MKTEIAKAIVEAAEAQNIPLEMHPDYIVKGTLIKTVALSGLLSDVLVACCYARFTEDPSTEYQLDGGFVIVPQGIAVLIH